MGKVSSYTVSSFRKTLESLPFGKCEAKHRSLLAYALSGVKSTALLIAFVMMENEPRVHVDFIMKIILI